MTAFAAAEAAYLTPPEPVELDPGGPGPHCPPNEDALCECGVELAGHIEVTIGRGAVLDQVCPGSGGGPGLELTRFSPVAGDAGSLECPELVRCEAGCGVLICPEHQDPDELNTSCSPRVIFHAECHDETCSDRECFTDPDAWRDDRD